MKDLLILLLLLSPIVLLGQNRLDISTQLETGTQGDLILYNASGEASLLNIGANTYVLRSDGTTASWQDPLTFANGMFSSDNQGGTWAVTAANIANSTTFTDTGTSNLLWDDLNQFNIKNLDDEFDVRTKYLGNHRARLSIDVGTSIMAIDNNVTNESMELNIEAASKTISFFAKDVTNTQTGTVQAYATDGTVTLRSTDGTDAVELDLLNDGFDFQFTNADLRLDGSAGTAGQVLTSGGSGAAPTWTTVSSTFDISDGTTTDEVNATDNTITFADGLSVDAVNTIQLGQDAAGAGPSTFGSNRYIDLAAFDLILEGDGDANTLYVDGSAGGVGFGTIPDASTRVHILGEGATSATTALKVEKSNGASILESTNDGFTRLNGATQGSRTLSVFSSFQDIASFQGANANGAYIEINSTNAAAAQEIGITYRTSTFTNVEAFAGVQTDKDAFVINGAKGSAPGFAQSLTSPISYSFGDYGGFQYTTSASEFTFRTNAGDDVFAFVGNTANANGATIGTTNYWAEQQDANHEMLAKIVVGMDGPTANQRGGKIQFFTKEDGVAGANAVVDILEGGDLRFYSYGSARNDTGTTTPANFLYTDASGNLLSSPNAPATDNYASASLTADGSYNHTWGANNLTETFTTGDYTLANTGSATAFVVDGTTGHVGINTSIANAAARYEFNVDGKIWLDDGNDNTIIGDAAGVANTTGSQNVFIGDGAGESNTSGFNNVAIGFAALNNSSANNSNTAVGVSALLLNETNGNTALGYQALRATVTGFANTGIGSQSLIAATGSRNSGLGVNTGLALVSGSNNIFIGHGAAEASTAGSNNIIIGYEVDAISSTGSNQLNFGNIIYGTGIDGTGTNISSGNLGFKVQSPAVDFHFDGEVRLDDHGSTRDDTGTTTPANFLYTDASGNLLSSPNAPATDNIYTADGTLTAARTLTSGGNNLTFDMAGADFITNTTGRTNAFVVDGVTGNSAFGSTPVAGYQVNINPNSQGRGLLVSGAATSQSILVQQTHASGTGIYSQIFNAGSTGTAVFAESQSGPGITARRLEAVSDSDWKNNNVGTFDQRTTGTAAASFGGTISLAAELSSGAAGSAATLGWYYTDPTAGASISNVHIGTSGVGTVTDDHLKVVGKSTTLANKSVAVYESFGINTDNPTAALDVVAGAATSNGDVRFREYPASRNDTGTTTPANFLYTDASGNLLSSPNAPGTLSGAINGISVEGTNVQLGHDASGSGTSDFDSNRYIYTGAFDLETRGTGGYMYFDGSTGNVLLSSTTSTFNSTAKLEIHQDAGEEGIRIVTPGGNSTENLLEFTSTAFGNPNRIIGRFYENSNSGVFRTTYETESAYTEMSNISENAYLLLSRDDSEATTTNRIFLLNAANPTWDWEMGQYAADSGFSIRNNAGTRVLSLFQSEDIAFDNYPATRDDTGTTTPANFLYTDASGNLLSSPNAPATDNIYTADGTLTSARTLTSGGNNLTFDMAAADFKVSSTGNANALFVDGSADNVGIGTATPLYRLHVYSNDNNFGIRSQQETSSASIKYGGVSTVAGALGTGVNTGFQTNTTATGGATNYGFYSQVSGGSNSNYGLYTILSGAATTTYGNYNDVISTGTTSYGTYSNVTGAGTTNFGGRFTASNATTNYAGYFYALGGTTNYAIYAASGEVRFVDYGSARDDTGTTTPANFLYTDASGNLLSSPNAPGTVNAADNGTSLSGTTVQLGHAASGSGASDFTANRYLYTGAFDLEVSGTGGYMYWDGSTGSLLLNTADATAHSTAKLEIQQDSGEEGLRIISPGGNSTENLLEFTSTAFGNPNRIIGRFYEQDDSGFFRVAYETETAFVEMEAGGEDARVILSRDDSNNSTSNRIEFRNPTIPTQDWIIGQESTAAGSPSAFIFDNNAGSPVMTLFQNEDIQFIGYGSARNDTGTTTPANFLYTDATGNLLSSPNAPGTVNAADNGTSLSGTTVQLGHAAAGTGASDFTADRFLYLNGNNLEIGGSVNASATAPVVRFEDSGDVWFGADGTTNANNVSSFFFDKSKSSIVTGTHLTADYTGVGTGSLVVGNDNTSTGNYAVIGGTGNTNDDAGTAIFGDGNTQSSGGARPNTLIVGLTNSSGAGRSIIVGRNNATSTNLASAVFGDANTLSGGGSGHFLAGRDNTVNSANSATAIGNTNNVTSERGVAIGYLSQAVNSTDNYAFGFTALANSATGKSMAIGERVTASGESSLAAGSLATASGDFSIALSNSTSSGGSSLAALGGTSTADYSFSSGLGTSTEAYASTAIGVYPVAGVGQSATTYVATDELFKIGNGTAAGARSNAMVVYKNGNIQFDDYGSARDDTGTTTPANFLYTDATGNLLSAPATGLQNTGSRTAGSIYFQGATGDIDWTEDNANFFYDNANNALIVGSNSSSSGAIEIRSDVSNIGLRLRHDGATKTSISIGGVYTGLHTGVLSDANAVSGTRNRFANSNTTAGTATSVIELETASDSDSYIALTTDNVGTPNTYTLGIDADDAHKFKLSRNQSTLGGGTGNDVFVANLANNDLQFPGYDGTTRDDTGATTPANFLYTDASGNLLSSPNAPGTVNAADDGVSLNGTTVELGHAAAGTGASDFTADRFLYLNGNNLEIGGSVNAAATYPVVTFEDTGDIWFGADGLASGDDNVGIVFFDKSQGSIYGGKTNTAAELTGIGATSFAWGDGPNATGLSSIVIGNGSATGSRATAFGNSSLASGTFSVVMGGTGNSATSSQSGTFAGSNSLSSNRDAVVLGGSAHTASGDRSSITGGSSSTVSGEQSYSVGGRTKTISSVRSGSIGGDNITITGAGSHSIGGSAVNIPSANSANLGGGTTLTLNGSASATLAGADLTTNSVNSVVMGVDNFVDATQQTINWDWEDDLFVIGNSGLAANTGHNALTVQKNGWARINAHNSQIAAGTTTERTPLAGLHLDGLGDGTNAQYRSGALLSPMTTVQRDAIPAGNLVDGLLIYNTTTKHYDSYNGTNWDGVGSYINTRDIFWGAYGSARDNSGATDPVNFLYTDATGNVLSAGSGAMYNIVYRSLTATASQTQDFAGFNQTWNNMGNYSVTAGNGISLDNNGVGASGLFLSNTGTTGISIAEAGTGDLVISNTGGGLLDISGNAGANITNTGTADLNIQSTNAAGSIDIDAGENITLDITDGTYSNTATNGTAISTHDMTSTSHTISATDGTETGQIAVDKNIISMTVSPRTQGGYVEINGPGTRFRDGYISRRNAYTQAAIAANTNNWVLGDAFSHIYRVSSTANVDVTGIDVIIFPDEVEIILVNVGANNIKLKHDDANSAVTNRILCPNNADFTIRQNGSVTLWYDTVDNKWRMFNFGG